MSIIKDIFDLIEKLGNSIKDRKILNLLFPIREKLSELQNAQTVMERNHFQLEREQVEKTENLKASHSKEVNDLKASMDNLKSLHEKEKSDLLKRIADLEARIKSFEEGPATGEIIDKWDPFDIPD